MGTSVKKPWWLKMGSLENIPSNTRPRVVLVESGPGAPCRFVIYHGEPVSGDGIALDPDKTDLHNLIAAANRELRKM